MAPRGRGGGGGGGRGGGRGKSGNSAGAAAASCSGCKSPADFITLGIEEPEIVAAVAFAAIATAALIAFWILSWKVKRIITYYASPKAKEIVRARKFGLGSALFCNLICELFFTIDIGVSESSGNLQASYLVFRAFIFIFMVMGDAIMINTIYCTLQSRFCSKTSPQSSSFKGKVFNGYVWSILVIFFLTFALISIDIRGAVQNIQLYDPRILRVKAKGNDLDAFDIKYKVRADNILQELQGLAKARDGIQISIRFYEIISGIFFTFLSLNLIRRQRQTGSQSKMLPIFMGVTLPALIIRGLAMSSYSVARILEKVPPWDFYIAQVWTRDVPSVIILASLVWIGLQPDWFIDMRPTEHHAKNGSINSSPEAGVDQASSESLLIEQKQQDVDANANANVNAPTSSPVQQEESKEANASPTQTGTVLNATQLPSRATF